MQETILIVEDEAAIADSIAYALRTDGFAARHVGLGTQALAALREAHVQAPSLVVLDVGLPDMKPPEPVARPCILAPGNDALSRRGRFRRAAGVE
jgi:two-component system, OmpR family, catabolic regulation response regulator CreB